MADTDAIAGATIELLEARLRRLSYLLTGASDYTGVPTTPDRPDSLDETVSRRVARLDHELEKLSRSVPAVRDVLQLRMSPFFPRSLLPLTARHRLPLPGPLPTHDHLINLPTNPGRPNIPNPHINYPLLRNRLPRNRLATHITQRPPHPRRRELRVAHRAAAAARQSRAHAGGTGGFYFGVEDKNCARAAALV